MPSLTDAFLGALGSTATGARGTGGVAGITGEIAAGLEEVLVAVAENGERAWPGVQLARADLAVELARAVGAAGAAPTPAGGLAQSLAAVHASDFYLACACARGDAA